MRFETGIGNRESGTGVPRRLLRVALVVAASCLALPAVAQTPAPATLNSGDTAWMIVASMLVLMMTIPGAALFYGGMVLCILPQEPGVSWQAHMGGAVGGFIAALLFRRLDPTLPRKRYSWEDEEESIAPIDDELEPPAPREVPVLWVRPQDDGVRGVVLRFPPREPPGQ